MGRVIERHVTAMLDAWQHLPPKKDWPHINMRGAMIHVLCIPNERFPTLQDFIVVHDAGADAAEDYEQEETQDNDANTEQVKSEMILKGLQDNLDVLMASLG